MWTYLLHGNQYKGDSSKKFAKQKKVLQMLAMHSLKVTYFNWNSLGVWVLPEQDLTFLTSLKKQTFQNCLEIISCTWNRKCLGTQAFYSPSTCSFKFLNSTPRCKATYLMLTVSYKKPRTNLVHVSLNCFSNSKPLRTHSSFICSCYKKWQEAEWQNDPQDGTCHRETFPAFCRPNFVWTLCGLCHSLNFPPLLAPPTFSPPCRRRLLTWLLKPFPSRSQSKTLIWNLDSEWSGSSSDRIQGSGLSPQPVSDGNECFKTLIFPEALP